MGTVNESTTGATMAMQPWVPTQAFKMTSHRTGCRRSTRYLAPSASEGPPYYIKGNLVPVPWSLCFFV
ncbi:hypothetical protein TWF132_005610 [Orbilia oligospora]|nr:hypothetical protein TWF132_005610 [Orbilia oligospora]